VIVDDEEMVLTSLRSFLTLETEYEVKTYDAPAKAIESIKESTVDLVISDYLMPGMNGIEFLLEIKKLQPYATRILLTGYADKENAIKAINEVGLYQYVEKPWDNEELKLIIQNGLERRFLMERLHSIRTSCTSSRTSASSVSPQVRRSQSALPAAQSVPAHSYPTRTRSPDRQQ
jgi:DNA-binding NtrC family response regulator